MNRARIDVDPVERAFLIWFHEPVVPWNAIPVRIAADFDAMGRLIAGEIIDLSGLENCRMESIPCCLEFDDEFGIIDFRLETGTTPDTSVVAGAALVDDRNLLCGFRVPLSRTQLEASVQLYRDRLR